MKAPVGDGQSLAMRLLFKLLHRIRVGKLKLVAPDGTPYVFQGPAPGPEATLIVQIGRAHV